MRLVPANCYTIDELTAIYNQTRIDYMVDMQMTARQLQAYIDVYDVNLEASVVAADGDEASGLCLLGIRDGRAWITRLGVLPTSRRNGKARAMVKYVIARARERGIPSILLEVIAHNEAAVQMFTRLGFRELRRLLILHRPPGMPPDMRATQTTRLRWLEETQTLTLASARPWHVAWTNQIESLRNAGGLEGLYIEECRTGHEGWISFKRTARQLKRVIVGPANGSPAAPAFNLLHQLHTRHPGLEAIAENVPAGAPHLDAFYAHGYAISFSRREMVLE